MSMYTQLQDYTLGLKNFLHLATGVSLERIIHAKPETARRILKERSYRNSALPNAKTIEIDNFISFYISNAAPGYAEARSSVMQDMLGAMSYVSKKPGWVINQDMIVQIDIWGGPVQTSHEFVYNNQMLLKNYLRRNNRVQVNFRDLVTKDPAHPEAFFDVNCWYILLLNDLVDNSEMEQQFVKGEAYRATFDMTWMVSFYNVPEGTPAVGEIQRIILEEQFPPATDWEHEWTITSTTTSSSTTSSSSTTTTTLGSI